MTAAFYNTARLLDYGAAEMKRLAGRHTAYGLILSVGVIGAVFLVFVGLDSVFTHTVDIQRRGNIEWAYIPQPKTKAIELHDNHTVCPISTEAGKGQGRSIASTEMAVPVAVPDAPVLDNRFSDTEIFPTTDTDPFAEGGVGNDGKNNGVFNPYGTTDGKVRHEGTGTLGTDSDDDWKEYPDVLPQVDMNALRRNVVYPAIAQRRNLEGKVVLAVTIDVSGKIIACSVVHSTNEIFNNAALEAVRQSTFTPAMRNRQPVQFRMMIPIEFKMK